MLQEDIFTMPTHNDSKILIEVKGISWPLIKSIFTGNIKRKKRNKTYTNSNMACDLFLYQ